MNLKNFRRDIRIVLLNEAGQEVKVQGPPPVRGPSIRHCPSSDANGAGAVATKAIKLRTRAGSGTRA
jgi:hypothetical protein